jgi:hypothetical protein
MKKLMTFGVGAAFGLAMVATCGTNSTKHGLVDDAGTILSDAGKAVGDLLGVDLGIKDAAAAPTPMVGDCSQAEVQTETSASLVVTNTQYFAEFDPPGFDPTSNTTVTVTLCNYEYYGTTVDSYGAQPCVAGYTCTQSGYVPPVTSVPCLTTSFARVGAGKLVLNCGYRTDYNYTATPANNMSSGSRATKVYVTVQ